MPPSPSVSYAPPPSSYTARSMTHSKSLSKNVAQLLGLQKMHPISLGAYTEKIPEKYRLIHLEFSGDNPVL